MKALLLKKKWCKTVKISALQKLPSPIDYLAYLQGFVFDMDAVTLESGAPVTRIMATCTPNIIQVHNRFWRRKKLDTSVVSIYRRDATFPEQELLPGWLWAPMDTTTELAELPFRPWNTSIPICGQSHPLALSRWFFTPMFYNTFSTFQSEGQHGNMPVICSVVVLYLQMFATKVSRASQLEIFQTENIQDNQLSRCIGESVQSWISATQRVWFLDDQGQRRQRWRQ